MSRLQRWFGDFAKSPVLHHSRGSTAWQSIPITAEHSQSDRGSRSHHSIPRVTEDPQRGRASRMAPGLNGWGTNLSSLRCISQGVKDMHGTRPAQAVLPPVHPTFPPRIPSRRCAGAAPGRCHSAPGAGGREAAGSGAEGAEPRRPGDLCLELNQARLLIPHIPMETSAPPPRLAPRRL